ncbi:hypothetical protein ACIBBB_00190 [Streptomyces sp. NPDC051217]
MNRSLNRSRLVAVATAALTTAVMSLTAAPAPAQAFPATPKQ